MGKRGPKPAEHVLTNELCSYGCGRRATYKNKSGNLMCCSTATQCPVNRLKNSNSVTVAHTKTEMGWSCLTKEQRMGKLNTRYAVFGIPGKGQFKNALLFERGHRCECCKLTEWLGKPITLELEHSDGIKTNNTRENLKLLCPNCHSQTPTWRRKKSSLR